MNGLYSEPVTKRQMTTEPLHLAVPLPPRFQLRTVLKESPGTLGYRVFDASDTAYSNAAADA